ncbi:MAG: class I SAM-dependent methyltransferase [Verrucomicrobiae bacterium]|nr:class I SAM-dependent methyltransferase [Verrucomicrobiae bacterium]
MKSLIKNRAEALALCLLPSVAQRIKDGQPTKTFLERLVRSGMTRKAAKDGEWDMLRSQLAAYWRGGEGDEFYEAYPNRFDEWFLGAHYCVVEQLRTLCDQYPDTLTELYEIGCGDGKVLMHMNERFPEFHRLVGIDINSKVIERNRSTHKDPKVDFTDDAALDWLSENGRSGSVLMTYGGVLEYFTQCEVETIFRKVASLSPAAIVLVEPVNFNYDLNKESDSRPYGDEHSFSHNHRVLLQRCGFELAHQSECRLDHRWQMLVAMIH